MSPTVSPVSPRSTTASVVARSTIVSVLPREAGAAEATATPMIRINATTSATVPVLRNIGSLLPPVWSSAMSGAANRTEYDPGRLPIKGQADSLGGATVVGLKRDGRAPEYTGRRVPVAQWTEQPPSKR